MNPQEKSAEPIIIIDYGVGNISSVVNMLHYIGVESFLSRDQDVISNAHRLILPGVGAFDAAMARLKDSETDRALRMAVQKGAYLLGICIGFQLLLEGSEEGDLPGLGLVSGSVKRFRVAEQGLRVPHMGWNVVKPAPGARLFDPDLGQHRYYFAHSYYAVLENESEIAAECDYGGNFTCSLQRGRIFGVQFHPEKSHRFGVELLKRYDRLSC